MKYKTKEHKELEITNGIWKARAIAFIIGYALAVIVLAIMAFSENPLSEQVERLESQVDYYEETCLEYQEKEELYINIDDIGKENPKIYTRDEWLE